MIAAIREVNECANILEQGADAAVIDRMFRSLHTIKGNCKMVFLESFVAASHKLEDLFSEIRSGEIPYDDKYGQFAVVSINLIQQELESLITSQSYNLQRLQKLESIIDTIRKEELARAIVAEKATIAITDGHFNIAAVAVGNKNGYGFSFFDATDFDFFNFISDKLGAAHSDHQLFHTIVSTLAHRLNDLLARKVDNEQLDAAITFVLLSNNIRNSDSDFELTVEQVFVASGILSRFSGWSVAAELVLQSKENHDGTGVPNGLSGEAILPAAQALGLSIEFGLQVVNQQAAGYKQSLFSAVKAINAKKDSTYKSRLIERFNQIIKQHYLNEQQW